MSNTEQTPPQTQIDQSLIQDYAGEIDRPEGITMDSNVIPFPVKNLNETPDFKHDEQGELADQANPHGIDRGEIDAHLDHDDYLKSLQSIRRSIVDTNLDKNRQIVLQDDYSRANRMPSDIDPDILADAKSETAFQDVEDLVRPAGAPINSTLGSTALKIVVK